MFLSVQPLGACSKEKLSTVKPPTKRPTRLSRPSTVNSNSVSKPSRPSSSSKDCAPKFRTKLSYVRNEIVSWRGKNYRCSVARLCNRPKFQPSTKNYWKLAWFPIGSCQSSVGTGQNERPTRPTTARPANKPNKPAATSFQSNPASRPKPKPITPSSGNPSTQNERPAQPSESKPANKPNKPFTSSFQVNPAPKPKPKPEIPAVGTSGFANNNLTVKRVFEILDSKSSLIDDKLFLYQGSTPSEVYRYKGFIDGLRVMVDVGVAGKKFYVGSDSENGYLYGLVNIAAFLGQVSYRMRTFVDCNFSSFCVAHFPTSFPFILEYEGNNTIRRVSFCTDCYLETKLLFRSKI